jgi:hypothetical protein
MAALPGGHFFFAPPLERSAAAAPPSIPGIRLWSDGVLTHFRRSGAV